MEFKRNENIIILMDCEKMKRSMGWWSLINQSITELMGILLKVIFPDRKWFGVVRYLKL